MEEKSLYLIIGVKLFFFFNDSDARRSYNKKLQPLKAWIGPFVKRRRERDFKDWVRDEGLDAGLEQLKVIGREEDSGRKQVPVSRGNRDKQFGVGSFLSNLTAKGC